MKILREIAVYPLKKVIYSYLQTEVIGEGSMPKFLAVHPLPGPASIEEATPLGKKAKSLCTADAYWVCSWSQLNDKGKIVKIFCEWNGIDLDTVKKVVENSGMPTEGVYPMMRVDSEDFR